MMHYDFMMREGGDDGAGISLDADAGCRRQMLETITRNFQDPLSPSPGPTGPRAGTPLTVAPGVSPSSRWIIRLSLAASYGLSEKEL